MGAHLKLSLKIGLYGGITAVFVSLIGMVETFSDRDVITGIISLGHAILVINALLMGYLAAHIGKKALNPPGSEARNLPLGNALLGSALAGLVIGVALAILVAITDRFNIRAVLVNASPALVMLLTFEHGVGDGIALLAVLNAVFGLLGGALFVIPSYVRRPLVWGLVSVALFGMLADLLRITLTRPDWPTTLSKFLVRGLGLTPRGALAVFVVTVGLTLVWRFVPGLYRQLVVGVMTWVPAWMRAVLIGLVSAMLALRLVWFIGIDTTDLPFRSDCRGLEGGGAVSECLGRIADGLGSVAGIEDVSLVALKPFLSALTTAADTLVILALVLTAVLMLVGGVRYVAHTSEESARVRPAPDRLQRAARYSTVYLSAAALAFLPVMVGVFPSEVLVNIGLFVMMGFGINIVVGFAGLLDLGYVAFFAVGAYSAALLTSGASVLGWELSFWAALPFVFLVTAFAGIVVGAPVLRMRGDYLAIVTLGLGEIARFLALSDWLRPWLGGAQGILHIPNPSIGGLNFVGPQKLYYLLLAGSLVALFVSWRLQDSRVGRALVAMREDEDVADAMGINTVYYKLLAFAMGASIASFSGAVFAAKLGSIFPHSFNVIVSITALSLLIVGGIGSLPGVVAGAVALVGFPELLREFTEYRLLLYGAVLVTMMLVRPEGLLPPVGRRVDVEEEERMQDDWLKGIELTASSAGSAAASD